MADMTREQAVEVLLEMRSAMLSCYASADDAQLGRDALDVALAALTAQPAGEAVAWQYRYRWQLPNGGYCEWHECSKAEYERLMREVSHPPEIRALYTHPPTPKPGAVAGLVEKWRADDRLAMQAGHVEIASVFSVCADELEAALSAKGENEDTTHER